MKPLPREQVMIAVLGAGLETRPLYIMRKGYRRSWASQDRKAVHWKYPPGFRFRTGDGLRGIAIFFDDWEILFSFRPSSTVGESLLFVARQSISARVAAFLTLK
jgi:hypothetical protein